MKISFKQNGTIALVSPKSFQKLGSYFKDENNNYHISTLKTFIGIGKTKKEAMILIHNFAKKCSEYYAGQDLKLTKEGK